MNVSGTLRVPGDKSISHRALILSALANGPSRVTGILESADVHSTAGVLRSLGAAIPDLSPDFVIEGRGSGVAPQSGVAARLRQQRNDHATRRRRRRRAADHGDVRR